MHKQMINKFNNFNNNNMNMFNQFMGTINKKKINFKTPSQTMSSQVTRCTKCIYKYILYTGYSKYHSGYTNSIKFQGPVQSSFVDQKKFIYRISNLIYNQYTEYNNNSIDTFLYNLKCSTDVCDKKEPTHKKTRGYI